MAGLAPFPATHIFAYVLLGCFVVILAVFLWMHVYFSIREPQRLQSESFNARVMQMQLAQGKSAPVVIEAEPITVTNPGGAPPGDAQGNPAIAPVPQQTTESCRPKEITK